MSFRAATVALPPYLKSTVATICSILVSNMRTDFDFLPFKHPPPPLSPPQTPPHTDAPHPPSSSPPHYSRSVPVTSAPTAASHPPGQNSMLPHHTADTSPATLHLPH